MQRPEERFEQLYARHVGAVRAYALRRAPASAVDDVVAETFLVCWRRLERVPDEALPWLYAVARKTLANERRKRAREAQPASADGVSGPVLERDPALGSALGRLRERDREVLLLIAWEGLSLAETAAVLGCSPVACRVRFHRAKRRLARILDEPDAEPAAAPTRRRPEGALR
jgi:RNA polymerase sigma-70 factor (ECF subfamily)